MPESSLVMGLVINIVAAAVILIVGLWLAKRLKNILSGIMVKRGVDPMLASFTGSIVHILISAFIVIAALGELGIQTTSLVAIMGAAGLAIGLALQGSLANFASGVMIIAFRPFKVGDYVEAGGTTGTIENIKIFSTQLTTGDNKSHLSNQPQQRATTNNNKYIQLQIFYCYSLMSFIAVICR